MQPGRHFNFTRIDLALERHGKMLSKHTKYYLRCQDTRRITIHPSQRDRCCSGENYILNPSCFVVASFATLEIIQDSKVNLQEVKSKRKVV